MKYYVIAGEASGDLHGSNLIQAIKQEDSEAEFRAWGGDLMLKEGAEVIKHYKDLAFMGFLEVISNLKTILRNLSFCKEDISTWKPDAVILIDYPGFNLRIAEYCKKQGIKVIYYISPQIWAWKESRINKIKRNVDQMLVILPFEKDFYSERGMNVEFVGHPLLDAVEKGNWLIKNWKEEAGIPLNKEIIALLPGSRKQEIETMLPIMLEATRNLDQYHYVLAVAPSQPSSLYLNYVGDRKNISLLQNQTYSILNSATAALVTSGTATLETALFGVPEVVCYKGNQISYWIALRLVKVKYISLVNLVMDREIVKELIQDELNPANLERELRRLLIKEERQKMINSYEELKRKLGGSGASKKASYLIINFLKKSNKLLL